MSNEINFEKLAWAALYVNEIYEPVETTDSESIDSYARIMKEEEFLKKIRREVSELPDERDVEQKLIRDFLNKWRCRITGKKIENCAKEVVKKVNELESLIRELARHEIKIESADLSGNSAHIQELFDAIDGIEEFGPTTTSKILHIINPSLFVMTDKEIRGRYKIGDGGEDYVKFLIKMQEIARAVIEDFNSLYARNDPAGFLSEKLKLPLPLTLARYIDQYNWITITRNVRVPPSWHPCSRVVLQ
ncbi:MAG: hypothetical protein QME59_05685, partial [Candidatus Hydrothermarchaeota archaeon]|nr:hypothetical protein [Candidatus Hydrothermarchaeota archaeon]